MAWSHARHLMGSAKVMVSHLTATLPFFLSNRVPMLSGPAVVPSCDATSTVSLINRSGQSGLSRRYSMAPLGKHFEGVLLFKEDMPFCPWLVFLPTAWNMNAMAGAATVIIVSMR